MYIDPIQISALPAGRTALNFSTMLVELGVRANDWEHSPDVS